MKNQVHGWVAVAALCALLSACGGGGDSPPPTPPTVLPATVTISASARADAGASTSFSSGLANTAGLSFLWNFGDGTTSADAAPTHAYARTGTYDVTLSVANTAEDLRSATASIQVGNYSNVASLPCSQPDHGGWCWQHAIVTGHQINDVFFADATTAWAVGEGGTILKSSDGGAHWAQVQIDAAWSATSLSKIRFRDATNAMVLTGSGLALQSADGGLTWHAVAIDGRLNATTVSFLAYDAAQVVVTNGYFTAASHDDGQTWAQVGIVGGAIFAGTDCWSNGNFQSQVLRAANCGATATVTLGVSGDADYYYEYLENVAVSSPARVLALGLGYSQTATNDALAWASADGGATWNRFKPTGLPWLGNGNYVLRMLDDTTGWLTTPYGLQAELTTDGGHSWTPAATPPWLSLSGYYDQRTDLLGNVLWQSAGSRLSLSLDRGQTWQNVQVDAEAAASAQYSNMPLVLLQYTDADHLVVARAGRFYATQDGGQTWTHVLGPDARDTGATYAAGAFTDARHGTFLSSRGVLLSTSDGGQTWSRRDYGATSDQPVALHFNSASEGWLILEGRLAHTTDGGASWNYPLMPAAVQHAISLSWGDATHGWLTGSPDTSYSPNALYATADGGLTWTPVTLPANAVVFSAVLTSATTGAISIDDNSGYAVQYTTDGGATWKRSANNGQGQYGTLVHTAGHAVWWLGYGSVARSSDDGATFRMVLPQPGNLTSLAFADELHGWATGVAGNVLYTIDGGTTWSGEAIGADVTPAGVVTVDGATAWVMTTNGQVLATATAGL